MIPLRTSDFHIGTESGKLDFCKIHNLDIQADAAILYDIDTFIEKICLNDIDCNLILRFWNIDIISLSDSKIEFGLSGSVSSFTGKAALGLKDGAVTASAGAAMLTYTGSANIKIQGYNFRIKGDVYIGGATVGGSLGLRTGVKLGAGVGVSVWLEVRKLAE